jgi:hypothetical protein
LTKNYKAFVTFLANLPFFLQIFHFFCCPLFLESTNTFGSLSLQAWLPIPSVIHHFARWEEVGKNQQQKRRRGRRMKNAIIYDTSCWLLCSAGLGLCSFPARSGSRKDGWMPMTNCCSSQQLDIRKKREATMSQTFEPPSQEFSPNDKIRDAKKDLY